MRKKFLLFFAISSIVLLGLCSCSNDKDDEYKDAIKTEMENNGLI